LLAGQSQPAMDTPAFGSVVTKLRPSSASVPSHVWLQKFGGGAMPPEPTYVTGGWLGMAHAPLVIGTGHEDNPGTNGFRVKAFDAAEGLTVDRLAARRQLLDRFEPLTSSARTESSLSRFRERAFDLLTGSAARQAFDVDRESDAVRDRYGRNPFGQNLLLARRLIEAGVRLVNVVAWCGLAPGDKFNSIETWDMHGNGGIDIFGNGWNGLGWALPVCDNGVSALLEDLEHRGLLDHTLVVLVGEFGRTPRISRRASAIGRDHWPNCYSAMLAGAGVRGGAVFGSSDAQAAYVKDRPVSPEDFAATLYQAMGIPPETGISPDGFSVRASTGRPLMELL
ncbi:MAG: putative secreted protein, partial [Planctomycetota bacterium]